MYINKIHWKIEFTDRDEDLYLDGVKRLGITDKRKHVIYLDNNLKGALLKKVLLHELTHAWLCSYDYDISVEFEEFLCSFVDTHAEEIIDTLYSLIPQSLENRGFVSF